VWKWWRVAALVVSFGVVGHAQIAITGRVVDEHGAGVPGARVLLKMGTADPAAASSDLAGNFKISLPSAGEYAVRVERQGFYLYQGPARQFAAGSDLVVILNHVQEFSESIEVTASPVPIDPSQPADRKQLDNTEIQTIPYPAPQDYRNALPMMDGVVQDNSGRSHFNGGQTSQTTYVLDGFNISDPVTGRLETRINIESIQSMEVSTSRFTADNGRGSAGVLKLETRMGDDRFRFGGTNFVPSISTEGGLRMSQWTPRLAISGPFAKGRAWYHNGLDLFYSNDVIQGLPNGQNRTAGYTGSNLSRFQVNLTPSSILTGGFLVNLGSTSRSGLSFVNPAEATTNRRGTLYMSSLRHQSYFRGGALLDVGFADSRGIARDLPQGESLFQITPFGNRGNYFIGLNRHFYRQQWVANVFLPMLHLLGTHRLKFGIDFEREAFHQKTDRHDYQVLRDDASVARHVTFAGSPFQERKNFEGAQYVQDSWTPREDVVIETGLRVEWNEIVRDMEYAPRIAAAWSPRKLRDTKFSAGWGVYHDAIPLSIVARNQGQVSYSTFFQPGQPAEGPILTAFAVEDARLRAPHYQNISVSMERRMPANVYLRTGYMRRFGNRGFTFVPMRPAGAGESLYELANLRLERYDAFEISARRTFAGRYQWFAGYTRSSARSNAAVEYSLENPVFADQGKGPFAWDTPHRFHTWGWAPLPARLLPPRWRFTIRNTTVMTLLEYRTGFPFGVVSEDGVLLGRPNSHRMPAYFNVNLALERQFRALHYLWAWRFGFNNLTKSGNPNTVNNVFGTPQFLTYGRGQDRAFSVRLRFLGRR